MNINLLFGELVLLPEIHWYNLVGLFGTELFIMNAYLRLWEIFFVYVSCWLIWYYHSPVKIRIGENI